MIQRNKAVVVPSCALPMKVPLQLEKLNEIVKQNLSISVSSYLLSSTCGDKITSEVGIVDSFKL